VTAEISIFGLYVPVLLLLAIVAFLCTMLTGRFLMRTGFYRFLWHPALFELALFFIFLGSFSLVLTNSGY
jgi:hypothetical protein